MCDGTIIFDAFARTFAFCGPISAAWQVLMSLVQTGEEWQDMQERPRSQAMKDWDALSTSGKSSLIPLQRQDATLTEFDLVKISASCWTPAPILGTCRNGTSTRKSHSGIFQS